jgi:hypothetical protein
MISEMTQNNSYIRLDQFVRPETSISPSKYEEHHHRPGYLEEELLMILKTIIRLD